MQWCLSPSDVGWISPILEPEWWKRNRRNCLSIRIRGESFERGRHCFERGRWRRENKFSDSFSPSFPLNITVWQTLSASTQRAADSLQVNTLHVRLNLLTLSLCIEAKIPFHLNFPRNEVGSMDTSFQFSWRFFSFCTVYVDRWALFLLTKQGQGQTSSKPCASHKQAPNTV